MRVRFCITVPTTRAPAVLANEASSPNGSRGSAVDFGRITPTRIARSWRTDSSVRFSSDNVVVLPVRTRAQGSIGAGGPVYVGARRSLPAWRLDIPSPGTPREGRVRSLSDHAPLGRRGGP